MWHEITSIGFSNEPFSFTQKWLTLSLSLRYAQIETHPSALLIDPFEKFVINKTTNSLSTAKWLRKMGPFH